MTFAFAEELEMPEYLVEISFQNGYPDPPISEAKECLRRKCEKSSMRLMNLMGDDHASTSSYYAHDFHGYSIDFVSYPTPMGFKRSFIRASRKEIGSAAVE